MIDWLLDSDPALRWQVERDLAGALPEVWQATRARVTTEGWGARLLALQDPDGQWAGGAFFPAGFEWEQMQVQGQPWTATTWVLKDLREWGVDAAALGDTAQRLAKNSLWEYDNLPYWDGEVDCCINSWTLSAGLWLGLDMTKLADWFVEHRLTDGGWNCEWVDGKTRSSFHSTLNSLKGLLGYEIATGGTDASRAARRSGEEYLLERRLMRRMSSGNVVAPFATEFVFPFRWQYSVLNAADYFRSASLIDDTPPDPRMADAIAAIRAQQQPDGTWLQAGPLPGRVWFDIDAPRGQRSKWLTLSGTRVLSWWDAGSHS